jgi:hypothetical protein
MCVYHRPAGGGNLRKANPSVQKQFDRRLVCGIEDRSRGSSSPGDLRA